MPEPAAHLLRRWNVDPEWIEPLAAYVDLLERWNATHNLVSVRSREELVVRHIIESLQGAPHLAGATGVLADVGSGAGFPGVPLLIAKPGWHGVLVEPRRKRWSFLRLVIRELGLDAEAVERRYQQLEGDGPWVDAVVSRALGEPEELLAWWRDRLRPGGRVLFWTTDKAVRALDLLPGWRVVSWPLPGLDTGRLIDVQPCFT